MKTQNRAAKLFAILLSLLVVVGAVFTILVMTSNAEDGTWSVPEPIYDEATETLVGIRIGATTYNYGVWYDSAHIDAALIASGVTAATFDIEGADGLEWVMYQYGSTTLSTLWTTGIVIRPKTGATGDLSIPNGWDGYTALTGTHLAEVYVADGVTGIGDGVFSGQALLKSVYLADSVKTIGKETFKGCGKLESVTLESVETIGQSAFMNCAALTDVEIATKTGATLRSIGAYAFSGCTELTTATFGSGASNTQRATIGQYAFSGDGGNSSAQPNVDKLTTVVMGDNITLSDRVFYSCGKLDSFKAGDNITIGGSYVLYEDTALTTVTLGDNVVIGTGAFRDCYRLEHSEGKDYLDLSGVTSVGTRAFESCFYDSGSTKYGLKKVVVSDKLTALNTYAFADNALLSEFNLGDTKLTSIPDYAFEATGLETVVIPNTVKTIGTAAFSSYIVGGTYRHNAGVSGTTITNSYNVKSITSLTFAPGSTLTEIKSYAFYRQNITGDLEIPATTTVVGDYAFYAAGSMPTVTFLAPETMTVGTYSFSSDRIQNLVVNAANTFKATGSHAFTSNLIENLDIRTTGVISLGSYSFYQHNYMKMLYLSAAEITLGDHCFYIYEGNRAKTSTYEMLTEVVLNAPKISIGTYAFANNMNLAVVRMPLMEDKTKLTVGASAFGTSAENAYYAEESMTVDTGVDADGDGNIDTQTLTIQKGMSIYMLNMDDDGPMSKFNSGNYYSGVTGLSLTLESKLFPTCTKEGQYRYKMGIESGTGTQYYYYNMPIAALGHMYGEETIHDANCLDGEYVSRCCIRGDVEQGYGVDAEGYALGADGNRKTTGVCQEEGWEVRIETGAAPKLGHEYYAGKLYAKNNVLLTSLETIPEDRRSNFFVRYTNDGGETLISTSTYLMLEEEEQADYEIRYLGTEYLTKSEYDALDDAEKADYSEVTIGIVEVGEGDTVEVEVDGVKKTYQTPFEGYTPVYISFECFRGAHESATDPEIFPYAVAYIPSVGALTGKSNQTLSDIRLGIRNLEWKNPDEPLAGEAGTREFTAVYTPDGNGTDTFVPVEIPVSITITREDLTLADLLFKNLKQSTAVAKKDVTYNALPDGLTFTGVKYYDGTGTEKTLEELGAINANMNGSVALTFEFDDDVYNLVTGMNGTAPVYWSGSNYITEGSATVDNLASGYSVKSIDLAEDGTVTVVIETAFTLTTPALSMVEANGDIAVYDGNVHGFTLTNVPAASTITYTQWSTADASGSAVSGGITGSVTAPAIGSEGGTAQESGETATVYNDYYTISENISELVTNAGEYCFRIDITNGAYNDGEAYSTYVTVRVDKATVEIPAGPTYTYDGTAHTGFEDTADYTVTSAAETNGATNAGTYEVTLTLTSGNYKWAGQQDTVTSVKATWKINKLTVAVPSIDESKRTLPYNGHYQSPLIFTNVDTAADPLNPAEGDYKCEQGGGEGTGTTKNDAIVSLYLGGEWHNIYVIYNAYGLNAKATGQSYSISGNPLNFHISGLLDTQNLMWPYNQEQFSLGNWTITTAPAPLPTLTAEEVEYTGNVYAGAITLGGTWDFVNDDGVALYKTGAAVTYYFYDGFGRPLDGAPTEAGMYTVKVDLSDIPGSDPAEDYLNDTNYYFTAKDCVVECTLLINRAALTLEDPEAVTIPYDGAKKKLPLPVFMQGDEAVELDGVLLRYYRAELTQIEKRDEDGNIVKDANEQPIMIDAYVIVDEEGITEREFNGDAGEYAYFVSIDEGDPSYESADQAFVLMTITPAEQTVTAEKTSGSDTTLLEETDEGYTITANLGDEPLVLFLRGELDLASAISYDDKGAAYNGVYVVETDKVTVKVEPQANGGSKLTIAFTGMTEGADITVNAAKTANVTDAASIKLTVKVGKAIPTVTVTPALAGSTNVYTGKTVWNFSTTVTGKDAIAIDSTTTAVAIDTDGDYNRCTLAFYTTEADALAGTNAISEPVAAGTYYVVAQYIGDDNYAVANSAPVSYVIAPASLTVVPTGYAETYDGQPHAPATFAVTGVVGGVADQTITGYTVKFYSDEAHANEIETVKNVTDNATYYYVISATNFEDASGSFTVGIQPAALTAAAGMSGNKIYDGSDVVYNGTDASWSVDVAGGIGDEIKTATVTGKYAGGADAMLSAGKLTITFTLNGGEGFLYQNYTFNGAALTSAVFEDGNTYKGKIDPRPLTIGGVTANTRAYDGTTVVTLAGTPAITDGKVNDDVINVAFAASPKGTAAAADVGTQSVTADVSVITCDNPNYVIGTVNCADVVISQRQLTVSLAATQTKVYTGSPVTGYANATLAVAGNTYNTDAASVETDLASLKTSNLTYLFYQEEGCATPAVGGDASVAPTNVGEYYVKVVFGTNANYTAEPIVKKVVISPATLTVVPTAYADKTYDGQPHVPATFVVTGVVGGVADQPITGYTVKFYSDEAHANEIETVRNAADTGTYYYVISADNFEDATGSFGVSIARANVVITKQGLTTSRVYDGTDAAAITGALVAEDVANENVTLTSAVAAYNDKTANASKTITVTYTLNFGGADFANYTYTTETVATPTNFTSAVATESVSGSIDVLEISVSGVKATDRVYNGTTTVALDNAATVLVGILGSDVVEIDAAEQTGTIADKNADSSAKSVTVAWTSYTLKGADAANYAVTSGNAVTVTVSPATPTFEWLGSLVAGYSAGPVDLSYYQIRVLGNESPAETLAEGTTHITYTFWTDADCTTPAVTGSATTAPTDEGNYYVKATYSDPSNGNYTDYEESCALTVTPTGIFGYGSTILANDLVYDGKAHPVIASNTAEKTFVTILSDMLVGGEHEDVTSKASIWLIPVDEDHETQPAEDNADWKLVFQNGSAVTNDITVTNAGTYTYWVKITATSHLSTFSFGSSYATQLSVTVTPATLTVSCVVETSRVYDGTAVAAVTTAATVTGAVNDENVTVAATAAFPDKNAGTGKTVTTTFTLTFTGCSASNYVVVEASGNELTRSGNTNVYTMAETEPGVITAKEITVTGITATGRVYDGTTSVVLTGTPVSADLVAADVTAESIKLALAATATGSIADAKPATYTVTVANSVIELDGTDAGNYKVVAVKTSADTAVSVTIAKRQLELTYGGVTTSGGTGAAGDLGEKVYNGKAVTGYTGAVIGNTFTGGAETEDVTYTFYQDAACATAAVSGDATVAPTNVGTYYVKATVAANDYYLGATEVAKLVITPATLTVNATAYANKTYDGTPHAPATFTVTGVVNGTAGQPIEGYTVKFYSDSEYQNEIVNVKNVADTGTYYYVVSAANFADVKGNVAVSINPLAIALSSELDNSVTKVYDGKTTAAIKTGTVKITAKSGDATATALVSGEITVTATAAYTTKNVGTGKTVKVTYVLTPTGTATLANYSYNGSTPEASITVTESESGVITARELNVTGIVPTDFVYDGKTNVVISTTLSELVAAEIVEDDDLTLGISAAKNDGTAAAAASANIGDAVSVTVTDLGVITLTGADAGNYTVKTATSAAVKISAAEPTFTWPTTMSAVYTGAPITAAYYTVTVVGVAEGDASTGTVSYTFWSNDACTTPAVGDNAATAPTNVGTYYVKASIAAAGNYSAHDDVKTITITNSSALTFTVTGYGTDKIYDGTTHAAVTITEVKGVDDVSLAGNSTVYYSVAASATQPSAAFTDGSVWSTTPTDVKSVVSGAKYWYAVVAPNYETKFGSVTVTIAPFDYTVSATVTTEKVYDGTNAVAAESPLFQTAQSEDVIAITIKSVTYDDANVGEEKTITVVYELTFAEGVAVSDYRYNGSGTATPDGQVVTVTETVSGKITKADVTVSVLAQESVYDRSEPAVDQTMGTGWSVKTGTIFGSDNLGITLTKVAGVNVGTYDITATYDNDNYNVTFDYEKATFTVTPRPITVTIGNTSGVYGDTPVLPLSLLETEDAKGKLDIAVIRAALESIFKTDATAQSPVGNSYKIWVDDQTADGVYGNYEITFGADGVYTVTKRQITVTPDAGTHVYGTAVPTLTWTKTGTLAANETLDVTLACDVTKTSPVIAEGYVISVSAVKVLHDGATPSDVTSNYEITSSATAVFTVTKADFTFGFTNGAATQAVAFGEDYPNPLWFTHASGEEMKGDIAFNGTITFTSSDEEVATVDADGTVHALKTGSATITVTLTTKDGCNYNIPATATKSYTLAVGAPGEVVVQIVPLDAYQLFKDPYDGTFVAQKLIVSAEQKAPSAATGNTVTIYYSLDTTGWDAETASWSTEIPEATDVGTYVIHIKAVAEHDYSTYFGTVEAVIRALPEYTVTFSGNGGSLVGNTTIQLKEGALLAATDFPTATFTGHTFTGWKELSSGTTKTAAEWADTAVTGNMVFQAEWGMMALSVTAIEDQVYTGAPIHPTVTVKCGEATLTEGTDYLVVYSTSSVLVSDAVPVTAYGIGDYAGLVGSTNYKIVAADQTVTFPLGNTVDATFGDTGFVNAAVAALDAANVTFTYEIVSTSSEGVVTLGENGALTINKSGTVTIKATASATDNVKSGSATYVLTVAKADSGLHFENETVSVKADGTVTNPLVNVLGLDVTYSSDKEAVATVDGDGNVTIVAVGTANITASFAGDDCYAAKDVTFALTVTNASLTYTVTPYDGVYDGDTHGIVVSGYPEGSTVTYTVGGEASDNLFTNAGTYAVHFVISCDGYDSVEGDSKVTIRKAAITAATVTGDVYTGSAVVPTVASVKAGDLTLEESDYSLAYYNNVEAGSGALVIITAKEDGNFTGSIVKTFTITPLAFADPGTTITTEASRVFTGAAITPAVVLKNGGVTLVEGRDYTLAYADNVAIGTATVTATGIGNYSGTKSATFAIVANANDFVIETIEDVTYTGEEQKPTPKVTYFGTELTAGTHFTFSYLNNVDAGTATVVITGKSGTAYEGVVASATFTILPKNIAEFDVTADDDSVYTGSPILPLVVVVDGAKTLVEGTDYYLTFTNNVNVGDDVATVTVTGIGNYTGTASDTFDILQKELNSGAISTIADYVYTGSAIRPEIVVKDGDLVLAEGIDYTYTCANNVSAGNSAAVSVTFAGNYKGTGSATFTILPRANEVTAVFGALTSVYDGDEHVPTVTLTYNGHTLTVTTDYVVTYADASGAAVASPKAAGKYTATVTGQGNYTGTLATAEFEITKATIALDFTESNTVKVYGDDAFQNALVTDGTGDVHYVSSDPAIATVAADGTVTIKAAGIATITVTMDETANYRGATASFTLTVTPKAITGGDFTLADVPAKVYTGAAITPAVELKDGDVTLTEGKDYRLTYTNNTAIGTATVNVIGIGNYSDTRSTTFIIKANANDFEIAAISPVVYNGQPYTPTPVVRYSGVTLTAGVDFTFGYANNQDAGIATVTVTGKAGTAYEGVVNTVNFTIQPKSIAAFTVTADDTSVYTGKAITPTVTVVDGAKTLTEGTDYYLTFTDNVNVGDDVATVTVTGIGNYTGTASDTFDILQKELDSTAIAAIADYVYTGSAIRPELVITDGDLVLAEGIDYTYTCANNVSAGSEASVSVTFTGNYKGTGSANFTILPRANEVGCTFDVQSFVYDGNAHTPIVTLTYNGQTLNVTDDYTISYLAQDGSTVGEAKVAGKYTLVVTGQGNYTGTLATVDFQITKAPITVSFASATVGKIYGDDAFLNGVTASSAGTKTFASSDPAVATVAADGTVTIVGAGTATITVNVAATANEQAGTASFTLTVTPKDISGADFTLADITFRVYTGGEITPDVELRDNGKLLTAGEDYRLAYEDNIEIGTAKVTITGIGNYQGTRTANFEIMANVVIPEIEQPEAVIYNGEAYTPKPAVSYAGKPLTEGEHFEYSYLNNVNAGTATVVITGVTGSAYEGIYATVNFTIQPKDIGGFVVSAGGVTYTGAQLKPAVTVTDNGTTLVEGRDFYVTYTNNVNVGTANVKITAVGNYAGSNSTTFRISPKRLDSTAVNSIESLVYTGDHIKPELVVKDGRKVLTEGVDYVVELEDDVNVGATARVLFTFIGNYVGEGTKTFHILPRSNEIVAVADTLSFVYNGEKQAPALTLNFKNFLLKEGKDYTISYTTPDGKAAEPVEAGSYYAIATGRGNYADVLATIEFRIAKAPVELTFTDAEVARIYGDVPFVNELITTADPGVITFTSSDVSVAIVAEDGRITIVGAGTTVITATAAQTADFEGNTASFTLTVSPRDLSEVSFSVSGITAQVYTGDEVRPEVTLTYGNALLLRNVDYVSNFEYNLEVGMATLTVVGKGNFTGRLTAQFDIVANTNVFEIGEIAEFVYEGRPVVPRPEVKYAGKTLTEGADFVYTYTNNDGAGVATLTVVGRGSYEGLSGIANFRILAKSAKSDSGNTEGGIWGTIEHDGGFTEGQEICIRETVIERDVEEIIRHAIEVGNLFANSEAKAYADFSKDELRALLNTKGVKLALDISIQENGVKVETFEGSYYVTILLPKDLREEENLQIVFVTEDGNVEIFDTVRDGNYLHFETTHFSGYYVMAENTFDMTIVWIALAIVAAVAVLGTATALIVKAAKKKKN